MTNWKQHLWPHEEDRLADLDRDRADGIKERKRIRDRCYARARRDKEKIDG